MKTIRILLQVSAMLLALSVVGCTSSSSNVSDAQVKQLQDKIDQLQSQVDAQKQDNGGKISPVFQCQKDGDCASGEVCNTVTSACEVKQQPAAEQTAAHVKSINPADGGQVASSTSSLTVSFDIALDHDDVQSKFTLSLGGQALKGEIYEKDPQTFVFYLDDALVSGKSYDIVIEEGLKSPDGQSLKGQFKSSFSVK